jgi:hypothetical protein
MFVSDIRNARIFTLYNCGEQAVSGRLLGGVCRHLSGNKLVLSPLWGKNTFDVTDTFLTGTLEPRELVMVRISEED